MRSVFHFYDRAAQVGGFIRSTRPSHDAPTEVAVAVFQPDGSVWFSPGSVAQTGRPAAEAEAGHLVVEERAADRFAISYAGPAVHLEPPLDFEDPLRVFASRPHGHVLLELEVDTTAPCTDTGLAERHEQQHVRAAGRVTIDGTATALHALGLREQISEPVGGPAWRQARRLSGEFDEGFGFTAVQLVGHDGLAHIGGEICTDGTTYAVTGLGLETKWHSTGHGHERIAAMLSSAAGRLRITGQVLALLPLPAPHAEPGTRVNVGLMFWRWGTHIGFGFSEYLDPAPGVPDFPPS